MLIKLKQKKIKITWDKKIKYNIYIEWAYMYIHTAPLFLYIIWDRSFSLLHVIQSFIQSLILQC